MGIVKFTVTPSKLGVTADKLKEMLSDLSDLCAVLAGRAIKLIDRRFQRSGPGWQPLSEKTLKRRRKEGRGAKALLDTGKLRASIVAGGAGGVYEVKKFGFLVGTNVKYAATHQFGLASKNIPARPYVPPEKDLVAEFKPIIKRYLDDAAK